MNDVTWDVLAGIARDMSMGMIFLWLYVMERKAHARTAERCRNDLKECNRSRIDRNYDDGLGK